MSDQNILDRVRTDFPKLCENGKGPSDSEIADFIRTRESFLGDEVVLWSGELTAHAYKDQFGIQHPGFVVEREVKVTITDVRLVPGDYSDCWRYGLLAVDASGKEYVCHWNRFPETSSNPNFFWEDRENPQIWEWQDANYCFRMHACVRPDGTVAVPEGWKRCEEHPKYIYNPAVNEYDNMGASKPGCFGCLLAEIQAAKEQE